MFVVIDSSVLVGLINVHDHWHQQSVMLYQAMLTAQWKIIYLDCVIAETMSVVIRRLHEKKWFDDVQHIFETLNQHATINNITWVYPDVPHLYENVLQLMQSSHGALNFNDALIALVCQKHEVKFIASYDTDFDQITWLKRISTPSDVF
jgi:predicted nucleic acid-binding protein